MRNLILFLGVCFLSVNVSAKDEGVPHRSCGTVDRGARPTNALLSFLDPSDCTENSTTLDSRYETSEVLLLNVVVHILLDENGDGDISDEMVRSQIEILNEDYEAIPGTNGGRGTNTHIRFRLASFDPDGNPTTGITRSRNSDWHRDRGNYWQVLNWDPNRYINIYTNTAGGYLGYVPFLPADSGGANVGSPEDRIVVHWESFGRNSNFPRYDLGRTTVHEMGHFLGLEHTFMGGCNDPTEPNCFSQGDLICDTNSQEMPNFECDGTDTCSSPDHVDNYMNYAYDSCMETFTPQQSQRMRCTVLNYRNGLLAFVPSRF